MRDSHTVQSMIDCFELFNGHFAVKKPLLCFSPFGKKLRGERFARVKRGEYPLRKLGEQWLFMRQASELAGEVDLLHLILPTPNFLWLADRIKRRTGKAVVVSCLGQAPEISVQELARHLDTSFYFHGVRFLATRVLPKAKYLADRYVVSSKTVAQQLIDAGCPPPKVAVSLPPLPPEGSPDLESVRLSNDMRSAPTFLYLGHFLPNKGVDLLLEAFAAIRASSARLVLVWSGLGELKAVQRQVDRLELNHRVRIVESPVHRTSVLQAAVALVVPYRVYFGQVSPPMCVLEAFRAGVPVIAGDFPALRELNQVDQTLVLAESNNPRSFAQKMQEVLEHEEEVSLIREAQKRFLDREMSVEKFEAIYHALDGVGITHG